MTDEGFRLLMTGALDNELSTEEEKEFRKLLASSPEYQREWNSYKQLKDMTMQMKFAQPPAEVWDKYWVGIYNRLERRIGWILTSIGTMVLLFYGAYEAISSLLRDVETPWFLKAAILTVAAGLIIVFVSVVREKFFTHKIDAYKEVRR